MATNQIESDLGYVRDLVKRSERRPTPTVIYLLWAAIILVGFALVDLAPGKTIGIFWMIAAPAGSIISALLGHRAGKSRGQIDRRVGIRHALHWSGMLIAIALAILLPATGSIPGSEIARVILLIVAFGWWTAGVHFDRVFMWLGGVMMVGFIGTFVLSRYAWTALGLLLAVALIIVALRRGRGHVPQES